MANKGLKIQKKPIKLDMMADILKKAMKLRNKHKGNQKYEDLYRCALLFRYYGMHPRVIAQVDYKDKKLYHSNLREGKDIKGRTLIVWDRPKKKGIEAHTSLLKVDAIYFDVEEYYKEFNSRKSRYKRSTLYIGRLMKLLGKDIKDDLSPLTFRHSLAVELLVVKKIPMLTVCRMLNISPKVLREYAKVLDIDMQDMYARAMGIE